MPISTAYDLAKAYNRPWQLSLALLHSAEFAPTVELVRTFLHPGP
jgi:hypothetical protein